MTRMQIYLPHELFIQLKQKAQENDVSMADIIRTSLKKTLPAKKKTKDSFDPFKSLVGCIKTKKTTNAVQDIHDYYEHDAL